METGIIKKWNEQQGWGIIYCPGDRRFFLHANRVIKGSPKLFSRVTFEIGPPRNSTELPPAINVVVGGSVAQPSHSVPVSPEVKS